MPKLNICMVASEFPPFFWVGGEGIYAAGLSNALLKLGLDVTVLTTDLTISKEKQSSFNTGGQDLFFIHTINKRPFRMLSFYLKANAKIKESGMNGDLDIVHYTNDYGGPIISERETNKPVIVTMHHPYVAELSVLRSYGYQKPTYFFTLLSKYMSARFSCKRATKIIAISRYTAEGIIHGYNISPEKITVIPNAVDTTRFNPSVSGHEIREKWKLHSEPLVVFVGRLVQTKGLEYLLKAFTKVLEEIPDAKLIVVGEFVGGGVHDELLIMSKKLNLKNSVKFVGKVSSEDLPKLYAAADLVVLPSLMEGMGLVLLEAMATAKPCVATTVGGIPEAVVDGETGILIPPRDPSALCKAICTILKDSSLCKKLGDAGRRRVEKRFTWDVVAKETAALYQQTLQKS